MAKKTTTLPAQILQVVNNTDANIAKSKIQKIAACYAPYMQQVNDIAQDVAKLEKGNAQHVEIAKRARIDLGKICSAVEQQKKQDKASLLLEANYYQALFNTVNGAARLTQDEAKQIEKHAELEAKRIREELQATRIAQVQQYGVDGDYIDLGSMDEEVWNNFYLGTKTAWQQKQQAEKQAQEQEKKRAQKLEENYQKLAQLKNYGVTIQMQDINNMSQNDFDVLYAKSKKAYEDREKKKLKEQEEARKKLQAQQQAEQKLKQQRTKQIEVLGGFSNIHGMHMHSTLDLRFSEADLLLPKAAFDKLLKNAQQKIATQQKQDQLQEERSKQLHGMNFKRQSNKSWKHTGSDYVIWEISMRDSTPAHWKTILNNFEQHVQQQAQAQKILQQQQQQQAQREAQQKQQRELELAPDKKKLEVFMEQLLSTEAPQLQTEEGNKLIGDINTMLIKMDTYVSEKLEQMK